MVRYYMVTHYYDGRKPKRSTCSYPTFTAAVNEMRTYTPNEHHWYNIAVSFDNEEPTELAYI